MARHHRFDLLNAAEVDGMTTVVCNGWPLYCFARDEAPGDTNGQGRGQAPNIWYLVSPDGNPIEGHDEEAARTSRATAPGVVAPPRMEGDEGSHLCAFRAV